MNFQAGLGNYINNVCYSGIWKQHFSNSSLVYTVKIITVRYLYKKKMLLKKLNDKI